MKFACKPEKCRRSAVAGYSLVELMLVLGVLAVVAAYTYPGIQREMEERAVGNTAHGIRMLAELALQYHADQTAWPADPAEIERHFSLAGFLHNRNGFGFPYTLRPGGGGTLQIVTETDTDGQAIALRALTRPLAGGSGEEVVVTVPAPSADQIHDALLPRDGSRPMTGDLDLNGGDIRNAGNVNTRDLTSTGRMMARAVLAETVSARALSAEVFRARRFLYDSDAGPP